MFYVHQILARKGPLATVWIAAHLQHRLKKSQYTTTDVVSATERIINPEAPIALRLSSHLMLGVVRIHAKKVDYLYQDCIVVQNGIQKTLIYKNVDLTKAAANPPPESVTLPVFQLDDLDIDDCLSLDGDQDRYQKSRDEITLPARVPIERNTYVAITFDEEDMLIDQPTPETSRSNERVSRNSPPGRNSPLGIPHSADGVYDQDIPPQVHVGGGVVWSDPVQTDHGERTNVGPNVATNSDVRPMEEDIIQRTNEESSPQSYPSIEVRRDAVHDPHPGIFPLWTEPQTDPTKAQSPRDHPVTADKERPSPLLDDILNPEGQSSSDNNRVGSPSANRSEDPPSFDNNIFADRASPPEFAVRSTPPVEPPPQGPQLRPRRAKRFLFDETIVMRNESMRAALADTRDLKRKRKPRPVSVLGAWKLRNRRKMDHIFDEPSVSAICPDLCNVFNKDFITEKLQPLRSEDASSEQPRTSRSSPSAESQGPDSNMEIERLRSVQSPARVSDIGIDIASEPLRSAQILETVAEHDMEIEHLRQPDGYDGNTVLPEFTSAPNGFTGSPIRNDDFTPFNLGSDYRDQTLIEPQLLTTPGKASTPHLEFNQRVTLTPNANEDGRNSAGNDSRHDNYEAEDLHFLEGDSSPTSSQQSQKDVLSARTRAVEQFLKGHTPPTQTSENQTDYLSLNRILQGKTRKVCARMFYETLVLKSHGRIDAHQEEAYGDIRLKLTRHNAAQG